MTTTSTALAVHTYEPGDEAAVIELLSSSLGAGPAGRRPAVFFRWKHFDNPFGRSFMLVAEANGRIVGLRAFMRWEFTTGSRRMIAVRAVDTATHPDYQGRGIFSRLTLAAVDALRGHVDIVFNTPNEKSLPGYLKMGWRTVGSVPIRVRVRRPLRFAVRARSLQRQLIADPGPPPRVTAPSASDVLRDAEGVSHLLERARPFPGRLSTPRTVEYLRWRYGAAPLLDYRAIGDADGLAVFRVRPRGSLWEATVSEMLVPEGETAIARPLLRAVAAEADVDHLTISSPPGSDADRALRRRTFPAPGGMTLVTNPLANDLRPDPRNLASWALSLGDLEVF